MSLISTHFPITHLVTDPRDGLFTYSDPLTGDILLETIEQGTVDTLVKQSYLVRRDLFYF